MHHIQAATKKQAEVEEQTTMENTILF